MLFADVAGVDEAKEELEEIVVSAGVADGCCGFHSVKASEQPVEG